MFSDLLDRKQATLAYINIDLKKSKTLHFFKGVSVSVFAKNWKPCLFSFLAQ